VWLADVSAFDGVVDASTRPGTPPGLTVVDLVPSGTSQGDPATAVVEQLRANPPAFDTQVGGPAAELLDVKDKLAARLPLAAPVVVLATLVLLFMMTGSLVVRSRPCS
jgi:RND superfamily putative drug exporter